ncbi:MAG: tyrosine-protein phosphatase [Anaerolineales bacterium]|nr:MAG: tyrosine-protein phosphatase [Anaerolineales bacterium]
MFEQISIQKPLLEKAGLRARRRLPFSGAGNFRDLGGYPATDGGTVRWGVLYRSGALDKMTSTDLKFLAALNLERVIDFRAAHEKERAPDRLPPDADMRVVEIPILDASTKVWHEAREEMIRKLKDVDPADYMTATNVELATTFTPEMRRFIREVLSSNGRPLLFHCAAGKDRTGFGAALLLRLLGVPQDIVMQDYVLTNTYFLAAHTWRLFLVRLSRGERFASVIRGFMDARPAYLSAAFDALEREHGSFEKYARNGLGLSAGDVERLKEIYLEQVT